MNEGSRRENVSRPHFNFYRLPFVANKIYWMGNAQRQLGGQVGVSKSDISSIYGIFQE